MAYWLVKTEPEEYSYADLIRMGRDRWNGVRNFTALRHLWQMRPGDLLFVYHTGREKAIVGVAEAVSPPYPDPAAESDRLAVVDVEPRYALPRPVTLHQIKGDPAFAAWELVRQPRLSVMPVSGEHWRLIHQMSGGPAPVGELIRGGQ